jgi:hypothetical protein
MEIWRDGEMDASTLQHADIERYKCAGTWHEVSAGEDEKVFCIGRDHRHFLLASKATRVMILTL